MVAASPLTTAVAAGLQVLALFLNPAHDAVSIRLPALAGVAHATLTLTDALGRVFPKVDIRAVLLRGTDKVLFVQEKIDGNR